MPRSGPSPPKYGSGTGSPRLQLEDGPEDLLALVDRPEDRRFCNLERRTGRGTGRDIVDHPPNGHDDLANVVAGVLVGSPEKRLVRSLLPSDRVRRHHGIRRSRRNLAQKLMER